MSNKNRVKRFAQGYPPGHPLHGYPGPPPWTVAICMPIADFKPDWACVTGILTCFPFFARPITYCGCSLVPEARNLLAHKFLHKYEKSLEWSLWIDSDIGFTPQDWCYMFDTNEPLVIAPYSKKNFDGTSIETGFGFVKVHRKVFDAVAALTAVDGKTELVPRFQHLQHPGERHVDYFTSGAMPNEKWVGEDAGFLAWANMAGFPARLEERCDLTHYGRHGYKLNPGRNLT